jgi:hypothetical protein
MKTSLIINLVKKTIENIWMLTINERQTASEQLCHKRVEQCVTNKVLGSGY